MVERSSSDQAIWIALAFLFTLGVVAGFSWSVLLMTRAVNKCVPVLVQSQSAASAAWAEAQLQERLNASTPTHPSDSLSLYCVLCQIARQGKVESMPRTASPMIMR